MLGLLDTLCAEAAPAQLHLHGTGTVCRLRFAALAAEAVVFERIDEVESMDLGQVCSVSFRHGDRPLLFLSSMVDSCAGNDELLPRLTLGLPAAVVGVELRRAQRVPVVDRLRALTLSVSTGEQRTWTPKLVNLSLAGMLIEFPKDRMPDLPVFTRVQVDLELGQDRVRLRGVVRRQDENRLGVFFPEAIRGAELDPPAALRRIFGALEQQWITKVDS